MSDSKTVRIVPAPNSGSGPSKTQGTQVWCGDERIKGIHKITLIAEPRNMWRAIIESTVQVDGEIAAVVRDQYQATPAPVGSQCGGEPGKPRNWIERVGLWLVLFVYGRAIRRAMPDEHQQLATLTVPRMEITREMVEEDQRRAACMAATHMPDHDKDLNTLALAVMKLTRAIADHDQRQAAHVAAGHSLTCTIDIERQTKEACGTLVEAFKAEQARDELYRTYFVRGAPPEAEQADERSRS